LKYWYQTKEIGSFDIHLKTLRNLSQFSDDAGLSEDLGISSALWPLFGIVWKSSEVLAHLMVDIDIVDKSFLEVGCGIGLPSHLLNSRHADITATDYHPEVEGFLNANSEMNDCGDIPFFLSDWNLAEDNKLGKFDYIIGSDILYQHDYEKLLARFIDDHSHETSEAIIVDPGRGKQNKFNREMKNYSFVHSVIKSEGIESLNEEFSGTINHFTR
jgi:ETFB lysine methyltransferase